eukprot:677354-Pleurochrysis_carterae.AAC.3
MASLTFHSQRLTGFHFTRMGMGALYTSCDKFKCGAASQASAFRECRYDGKRQKSNREIRATGLARLQQEANERRCRRPADNANAFVTAVLLRTDTDASGLARRGQVGLQH